MSCYREVLIQTSSIGREIHLCTFAFCKRKPWLTFSRYPICQKGPRKIAETLIANGANLQVINQNGDTLVLLCCRNGQSEVLSLFLNYVDMDFVNMPAHIDGFNAMFASVEANRPECIQVHAPISVLNFFSR